MSTRLHRSSSTSVVPLFAKKTAIGCGISYKVAIRYTISYGEAHRNGSKSAV